MPARPPAPVASPVASICLGVRTLEASVVFYEAIGLGPVARAGRAEATVQLDGLRLVLVQRDEVRPGEEGHGAGIWLRQRVQTEGELEAILTRVRRAGGGVLPAPLEPVVGERRAGFRDPDGHRWELSSPRVPRRDGLEQRGPALRRLLQTLPSLPPDPDTDDLGPALITVEDFAEEDTDEPTVLLPAAALVELEPDELSDDSPAPPPPAAPAPSPPTPSPSPSSKGVAAASEPVPTASPSPSPSSKGVAAASEPVPTAKPVEPAPPSTAGRVLGWAFLVGAPLAGGALAWAVLRAVMPG